MSLSEKFNAGPERKAQLALLEEALDILKEQKAISHENRANRGDIADVRRFLWEWGGIDDKGNFLKPQPHNVYAQDIVESQAFMGGLQGALVGDITREETALVKVLSKLFNDDAEKLKAFYAPAQALESPQSEKWLNAAAGWYQHAKEAAAPAALVISAAAVKFSGPQLVEQQVATINALIDDGKLTNKAKRVAWQVGKKLGLG